MKKLLLLLPLCLILGACQDQKKDEKTQLAHKQQLIGGSAVLPPAYLSIAGWKSCIGTKDMGTWKSICVPKAKPAACSEASWKQLTELTGKHKVPDC